MDNFETEKISELLQELLIVCGKKKINFTINQETEKLNIEFDSNHLSLNIPNSLIENEDIIVVLKEWLEKIKIIP